MRFSAPISEPAYVAQLAQGIDSAWSAACSRMGEVLAGLPPSDSAGPAGWLDPHQQILMQATALLIYAMARERHADPATITADDLRAWLATQRPKSLRAGLANMLRAGHDVSRDHGRWEGTDDPVLALWWEATHEDDHVPTIDGTYGVTVGWGLHQLAGKLAVNGL